MSDSPATSCLLAALISALLATATYPAAPGPARPSSEAPPLPRLDKPYTTFFRKLLAADPAEQGEMLASKPPQIRSVLERKLEEYNAFPPAEQELRLRSLDLRWYLTQLLPLSGESRQQSLQQIPAEDRPMVEERLRQWDRLGPELQQALRENEIAIRLLCTPGAHSRNPPGNQLVSAPEQTTATEEAIARWQALPAARRQQVYDHFCHLFELGPTERQEALDRLTTRQQDEWTSTLRLLAALPREQRDQSLQGLRRFAALSPEQRESFLRNAKRWQQLSPADQQVWRTLVRRFPIEPPTPPGRTAPAPPPMPPTIPPPLVLSNR